MYVKRKTVQKGRGDCNPAVTAGVPPAVAGGILPPGKNGGTFEWF